jgi:tetratricopeptide (TPR) repeat protein
MKFFCLALFFSLATATGLFALAQDDSWLYNRQGIFQAAQGNHKAAIREFEKACQIDPFNDSALTNLACAHNNLGVILAGKKQYDEAIHHFTAAKQQKPEDISIRLNLLSTLVTIKNTLAVEKEAGEIIKLRPTDVPTILKVAAAFQNTENSIAAQTTLEQLADKVPDNAEVHATLGRLLYKSGNLAEAEYHLSRANALSNQTTDKLKNFLDQVRKESAIERNSRNHTSIHFSLTCHESFSEEWAEELLELLEEAYEQIGDKLDFYPSQRSQVLIFQTEDFRNVHDLPEWAGGVYDGKIRLPVPTSSVRPASLRGAIRHEYTHHVIFLLSAGNCPIWLNEGLAQIFEFDSAPESWQENYASFSPELNDFANLVRNASGRKEVADLYRNAHQTTLKLINHFGWNSISAILERVSKGYSFAEATEDITSYKPEEIF